MKKGFTLIEVLIAVFLLTVGIVGVMTMFPLGVQTAKSSQMASVGNFLAQEKFEQLISKSYDDPQLTPGFIIEDYGDITGFEFYKRETMVSCVRSGDLSEDVCDYDLTGDPTPMKKVEVEIFWRSSLGVTEKSIKLAGLVSKR